MHLNQKNKLKLFVITMLGIVFNAVSEMGSLYLGIHPPVPQVPRDDPGDVPVRGFPRNTGGGGLYASAVCLRGVPVGL